MPFSTACGTPLSNFEAGLNYQDVSDPAVVVSFPTIEDPSVHLLAWTTTPWTLPSNLALCVNAEMDYVKIADKKSGKVTDSAKSVACTGGLSMHEVWRWCVSSLICLSASVP